MLIKKNQIGLRDICCRFIILVKLLHRSRSLSCTYYDVKFYYIQSLPTQLRQFSLLQTFIIIINLTMLIADDKSGDSIDPQFLTFRHNSPQAVAISGRSIYSQRFDCKSLQKFPIFDTHNSQRDDINERTHKKIKHSIKQKHLRTVKSQQKYRQIFSGQTWNAEQNGAEENQTDFIKDISYKKFSNNARDEFKRLQITESLNLRKQHSINEIEKFENHKTKNQLSSEQIMNKNSQMKNQLSKLVRNMKKQQRRQLTLNQQMQQLEGEIQQKENEIEEQIKSIEQLQQINRQNMKECNRIIDHIKQSRSRNEDLAIHLQNLEQSVDSSQISIETCRQDGTKDRVLYSQLKEGINDLNKTKASVEINVTRLQQEIMAMQFQIQQMKIQQFDLARIFGLSLDSFSSQNHSQNHSHSHSHPSQHSQHSSTRSANQNDRYY